MESIKNERGSALVSVTYLVLLLSMITVPLLMFVNQGATNATRNAESEKAYYAAESGSTILQRALTEAINTSQIHMDATTINTLVTAINSKQLQVNSLPLTLGNLQNTRTIVDGQPLFATEQTTTVAYTFNTRARTQSSTLRFKVDPGSASTNAYAYNTNSIFGINAVVPNSSMVTNKLQDGSTPTTPKDAPQQAITGAEYINQFDTYFNAQMALKPKPLTPDELTPAPNVPPTSYTYTPGSLTITSDRAIGAYYTGNISVKKSGGGGSNSIVINGDLVAQGNIDFQDYAYFTVNGNVIAGGDIKFSNTYLQNVKITGSMMSGSTSTGIAIDSGAGTITIGGDLTSKSGIKINSFSSSMIVEGSIIADGEYSIGQGPSLTVKTGEISAQSLNMSRVQGDANIWVKKGIKTEAAISLSGLSSIFVGANFSSKGNISFNGHVTTLIISPSGSMISGGSIQTTSIGTLRIDNGSISAVNDITFNGNISNTAITGSGNIIAGGNIKIGALDNWHLTGSMVSGTLQPDGTLASGGNITFTNGGMPNFVVDGSIYAPGELKYQSSITNTVIHGSIYAGTTSIIGHMTAMSVDGTFLSKGELNFPSMDRLTVGSFLGSEGGIHFQNIGDKVNTGGITTPIEVTTLSYQTYPVVLTYNPPGGTAGSEGSNPIITFDNWGS